MIASIGQTITDTIANHGVSATFLLMAVDALLPVGGELIMVVAGAIAAGAIAGEPWLFGHSLQSGLQTYVVLALSGTFGYLAGSIAGWLIGSRVDSTALTRYGRFVHLGPENIERAEAWFARHGAQAVFLGRLTPLVRSFISIPAGVFGEPFGRYVLLTLIGSALWCFGFAGIGWGLGSSYQQADHATRLLEAAMAAAAVFAGVVFWRRRRLR